jgi:hypothetical protein
MARSSALGRPLSWGWTPVSERVVASSWGMSRLRKMGGVWTRCGWSKSRRASSAPAYPVTPMTAVRSPPGVVRLDKVGLDTVFEGLGAANVGADDKDGVVASDGADDFFPAFRVDAGGDGLGSADDGADDDEVLGLDNRHAKVLKDAGGFGKVVFAIGGECVAGWALHEPEFADVAGERGLGDVEAPGCQFATQFVLVVDGSAIGNGGFHQQVFDRGVAVGLHRGLFMWCWWCRVKSRNGNHIHEQRDADGVTLFA